MDDIDNPHPATGEKVDKPAAADPQLNCDDPDALLARQFAEATAAAKPRGVTLRSLVRQRGDVIRELVVASNSDWTQAHAFVEQRLGRRVNLRSLQTYVADFFPQKALLRGPQAGPSLTEGSSEVKRADAVPQSPTRPSPSAVPNKSVGKLNPFAPRR